MAVTLGRKESASMAIRVLLADDHGIVREALKLLLEREGFQVQGEAVDGRQAVRLARDLQPDVAVLDLVMPLLNGLDAAREIRWVSPRTRTILLTARTDDRSVLEALQAGVKGCVLKSHEAAELIRAIREVSRGGLYLDPAVSKTVVAAYLQETGPPKDPLSPRERQVLQLIAEGKKTREVAELLCVSVKTAESHRARIMRKLDIRETAGLVRYAIRQGLSLL
jgi:DNA-binding NarL/FixJ family response regulator